MYQTGTISSLLHSHHLFQDAAEASCRGVGAVAWGEESQARGDVLVEEYENKVVRRNTEWMGTSGMVGNWLQLYSSKGNKQKKKWRIPSPWRTRGCWEAAAIYQVLLWEL
eukprot:scaffold75818_cov54-Attheya_sp.AAC.2